MHTQRLTQYILCSAIIIIMHEEELHFFSVIISDAILQQEVNVSNTKLIQARNRIS